MEEGDQIAIGFVELNRAHDPIQRDLFSAIERVYDSGVFVGGDHLHEFEEKWAAYCNQDYCIGTSSGTDALILAAAFKYRKKDWISHKKYHLPCWVPGITTQFTITGLLRGGARLHFADIDETGHLTNEVGTNICPVLLYGRWPNRIEQSAQLFDACQAHGWKGAKNQTACWSFYPTKNLGSWGDAGAITTGNKNLVTKCTMWRDTIHSRMSEVQAAILLEKLKHLDHWNIERKLIAEAYYDNLPPTVTPVCAPEDIDKSNHHIFAVLTGWDIGFGGLDREETIEARGMRRDSLIQFLAEHDIGAKVHYREPHRPYARKGESNVERWCASVVSLPCYPGLTLEEVREVCDAICVWSDKR